MNHLKVQSNAFASLLCAAVRTHQTEDSLPLKRSDGIYKHIAMDANGKRMRQDGIFVLVKNKRKTHSS